MTADTIAVLRTTPSASGGKRYATKRWIWSAALSEWRSIAYDAGVAFTAEERPVSNLDDVAAVLDRVRCDPRAFLVRGALTDDARDAVTRNPNHRLRRLKHQGKKGEAPTLIEVPRHWLMVDVDSYPLPDWADLATEPEAVIERAIHDLLPACFHDSRCFWQLSASAGFKPGTLKAHLFFWLARPISNEDLKLYLQVHAPAVDRAPYNAAQPHYIADPIIEGGHDPISRRTGWCKGMDDTVELPELDLASLRATVTQRRERVAAGAGLDARTAGTMAAALALLGDADGHEGFHAPLRRATWLYARQTSPKQRDDEALKTELRTAIRATTEREAGRHLVADIERFCSDNYLGPLIAGAFRRMAQDRTDAPEGMTPFHAAPDNEIDDARNQVRSTIADVLRDAATWHATAPDDRGKPGHVGLAIDVGVGKSRIGRELVAGFCRDQREKGKPDRVLWLVPTILLGGVAKEHLTDLQGAKVEIHRGREQPDPDAPGETMCLDLPAVHLAIGAGENVDKSVCGGRKGQCALFGTCGYQRQRAAVAAADVVIGAHELAFNTPAAIKSGLALTVFDESWWQDGLAPGRAIAVDGLADSVLAHPVWHRGEVLGVARQNEEGSSTLHSYRAALERALRASPDGYLRRDVLVAAGLTVEACAAARKLEWDRRNEALMRPGMSLDARQAAAEKAGINAQISRFHAMWNVLADLLGSGAEATGRAELEQRTTPEGDRRMLLLNTRRDVSDAVLEKPILIIDATMPVDLVRSYLPDLKAAPAVRVKTPNMQLHQVVGGFGKTSIIPHGDPETAENRRRRNLAAELRDLIENETRGAPGLIVTYEALEPAFKGIPGVETAHFNNVAGHDRWRDVRSLFVIGRPLPKPQDIRQLAAALTGEPVQVADTHREARAVRLADGTGGTVDVRAYQDPRAEAVRTAITDAEVVQAIGRARGVNRSADNPVKVWLMADVVTPLVVDRLSHWRDLAPSAVERMALRGVFLTSPADAAKAFPDLFPTPKAAEHALSRGGVKGGISPPSPYEEILIGEWGGNRPLAFTYRPEGRGQQTRYGWARPNADHEDVWRWLEERVGTLARFNVELEPIPERPEPPPEFTEAAMRDPEPEWEPAVPGRPPAPRYVPVPDAVLDALPEQEGLAPTAMLRPAPVRQVLFAADDLVTAQTPAGLTMTVLRDRGLGVDLVQGLPARPPPPKPRATKPAFPYLDTSAHPPPAEEPMETISQPEGEPLPAAPSKITPDIAAAMLAIGMTIPGPDDWEDPLSNFIVEMPDPDDPLPEVVLISPRLRVAWRQARDAAGAAL